MRLYEISDSASRVDQLKQFAKWVGKKINLSKLPKIIYSSDKSNVYKHRTFGSTKPNGDVWVYVGEDRNLADSMRTLCHELIHVHQFEIGTAKGVMSEEQRLKVEDEANAMAGRLMREYGKLHVEIYEGRTGSLQPDVAKALPATYAIPELPNQDPYLQYRFGVAIAGAKGRKKREEDGVPEYNQQSAWGENEIIVSYGVDMDNIIDDALKQIGMKGKRIISTKKSEEAGDVSTKSPVQGFKGY